MKPHSFSIGQTIQLSGGKYTIAPAGKYTITRLLPNDGIDREYRVQSHHDGHERAIRESEIRSIEDLAAR
ncbi:hypothetical protein ACFOD4_18890 [Pseudoroseomonas globiformis]|uniref:Uncharacterized protein n=1 Tax=Teichococcus globiformis TaxID=2307229 RepID=A0ABV7G349_9PROT